MKEQVQIGHVELFLSSHNFTFLEMFINDYFCVY